MKKLIYININAIKKQSLVCGREAKLGQT